MNMYLSFIHQLLIYYLRNAIEFLNLSMVSSLNNCFNNLFQSQLDCHMSTNPISSVTFVTGRTGAPLSRVFRREPHPPRSRRRRRRQRRTTAAAAAAVSAHGRQAATFHHRRDRYGRLHRPLLFRRRFRHPRRGAAGHRAPPAALVSHLVQHVEVRCAVDGGCGNGVRCDGVLPVFGFHFIVAMRSAYCHSHLVGFVMRFCACADVLLSCFVIQVSGGANNFLP